MKQAVQLIEKLCSNEGLEQTVKTTLVSYPGSVHMHYRRERLPGTLEITFWPERARIWISVHDNRKGSWTQETAAKLGKIMERAFKTA